MLRNNNNNYDILIKDGDYIKIQVDTAKSNQAKDSGQLIGYKIEVNQFNGEPLSYTIVPQNVFSQNGIYKFKANVKHRKRIDQDYEVKDIANGKYTFVVIKKENELILRIRTGAHYFLSGTAEFVYAAGEISFENGRIIEINDQSGAYHIDVNKLSESQRQDYYVSLRKVYEEVGLDFTKYSSFGLANKKPSSCCSNLFKFFTPRIAIAAVAAAAVVGIAAANNM